MTRLFEDPTVKVCGSAFHRDGRLFVGCLSGELLVVHPNGTVDRFQPTWEGRKLAINDLVFGRGGVLYITDFKGTVMEPTGGVYRMAADGRTLECVLAHLAAPNGVSLSPDGDILWVGETTRNAVLRIEIMEDGVTPAPIDGVMPVYYSAGWPGPDSNKVDEAGNVYQCIMGQGRVVVLDRVGVPVANILAPGRNEGECLRTTNLAFEPGTSQGYLVTSGRGGAWVCRFEGLAPGLRLFSHSESHEGALV